LAEKKDPQKVLSKIAGGFNKALGESSEEAEPAEKPCPHCGKTPSDGQTLGQVIGYPGSS